MRAGLVANLRVMQGVLDDANQPGRGGMWVRACQGLLWAVLSPCDLSKDLEFEMRRPGTALPVEHPFCLLGK